MATITLSTLRTKIRQRSDMENSSFVSDSELTSYINSSISALVDLVTLVDQDHFLSSCSWTHDGTDGYALPGDMYQLRGVEYQSGATWITLKPFNFNERNRGTSTIVYDRYHQQAYRYRQMGNQIKFTPTPASGVVFQMWYTPVTAELSGDSDSFNFYNGWDEYVVLDSAIKCLIKEESEHGHLVMERSKIEQRITTAAERRDASFPETVTDVYSMNSDYWEQE